MKKGKLNIVMGGQAGSEAKGKVSAWLADKHNVYVFACSMSPNAGHTVIKDGVRIITHHLPVGIVGCRYPGNAVIFMGPASVIDEAVLDKDVQALVCGGFHGSDLHIDERAAVICRSHIQNEEFRLKRIGSTCSGVGGARIDKLMRGGGIFYGGTYRNVNTREMLLEHLKAGNTVIYEMGQGFDLCLEHGIDPVYCTSRVVSPMAALAEMGIPAKYLGDVYAVIRTYPIRVNNRTGSSGPYPSSEITWERIAERCGAPHDITEYTTTTKLERRVFEFSWHRIQTMIDVCDPDFFCLQFANYLDWGCYGETRKERLGSAVESFVFAMMDTYNIPVACIGTGPEHCQMVDMEVDG